MRRMGRGYVGRNAKVDANQLEIVRALVALDGVTVETIGKPLDLLVGYASVNFIIEIKNPDGKDRIEPYQKEFLENWQGEAHVARSLDEVLEIIDYPLSSDVPVRKRC